jgi:hypothetical protein
LIINNHGEPFHAASIQRQQLNYISLDLYSSMVSVPFFCTFTRETFAMYNRADIRLKNQIEFRLSCQGIRQPCKVEVEVESGAVTLTGTVQYEHQKPTVVHICRTISGVTRVTDKLKVAKAHAKWDEQPHRDAHQHRDALQHPSPNTTATSSEQANCGHSQSTGA